MSSDNHSYDLTTQSDGSIKGTHSYYYERYSMYNSEGDGWKEDPITFSSLDALIAYFTNTSTRVLIGEHDVRLDGKQWRAEDNA